MQKVLILGAKGNLGEQLKIIFSDENYEVIAWDRDDFDVIDKELVFEKIKKVKPNFIINSAAYNAVDRCEESEEEFELAKKINGLAPGYLAEVAKDISAIFIHYSTDYIFGGQQREGYQENDIPSPINKYGESKLLGEELIQEKAKDYYIIRTSKLFGPKGKSELTKPSFFDIMIKLSQDKDKLDVVDEELSCFTYTPDLAKATKELLESKQEYGIYHLVNEGQVTWYEAVKELFKILNKDIKINPVSSDKFPRPARRPKYSALLNTKFVQLRNYREALVDYLNT